MEIEEEDKATYERHHTLCTSLNMDKGAAEEAWKSYVAMRQNYTLEGDQLHWLCCALYVACRRAQTPTVGNPPVYIEGNLVSLTRLLRQCNLSLVQFFTKCRKWIDMANLPQEFRTKFNLLERKFAVSSFIFKKYQEIFVEIFQEPGNEEVYQHKSKKPRNAPCTVGKVFDFCWSLFITIKGSFPKVADDLVNSYHLLLACCDLIYLNALLANRRDLLNPSFEGLPENFNSSDYTPPTEGISIIDILCRKFDGLSVDAKGIQQYCWKNHVSKLFEKKVLRGNIENLSGLLDVNYFESNFKGINKVYDEYALSVGEFDERIFLSDEASEDIGTLSDMPEYLDENSENQQKNSDLAMRQLVPQTPLTGRRWLRNEERDNRGTPLSNATHSVNRLINLLGSRGPYPSAALLDIYQTCQENPKDKIEAIIQELGNLFCACYGNSSEQSTSAVIFSEDKLSLAKKLFYKLLESILNYEKKVKPNVNLNTIVNQDIIHQCLFACSLEIVIHSYNSHRTFPWVLEALKIEPYYFYKVIEMVLRAEDKFSRDTVKHLSMIEEMILESLVWRTGSPLWAAIQNHPMSIPKGEDVLLPGQIMDEQELKASQITTSNPSIQRISTSNQSPGATLSERFSSPVPSRQNDLFSKVLRPGQSVLQNNQPISKSNGVRDISNDKKPKRTGSLSLFFRKFYNLSSVRMQDLCSKLGITDINLIKKIWTCFEYSIVNHITLMQDRHLDQILMCSIYVICKVVHTNFAPTERSFTEIMKCYRFQPQAASHVYRSVLLPKSLPNDSKTSDGSSENVNGPVEAQAAPLTPSSLAGTSSNFENMERGDLIKFYNSVYVITVQSFVKKFRSNQPSDANLNPLLSPLPRGRLTPKSPMKRVSAKQSVYVFSQKHSIYVRPLDSGVNLTPGSQTLTYCVERSPAKDLYAINNMIKGEGGKAAKRKITDFNEADTPPAAMPTADALTKRRIQNVLEDRIGQSH